MAKARTARILTSTSLAGRARLLEFEALDGPLGFVGGQYLIFNTGLVRPDGKIVKRAYSLLSADAEQGRFQICVQRLPEGPGSGFFHEAAPGTEVQFSGPWGQFLPDDSRPRPTLLVATDTGITAALGLLRAEAFSPQRLHARLYWLSNPAAAFLPEAFVREACTAHELRCEVASCPPPDHPERLPVARDILRRALSSDRPESAFLSGDGAVLFTLRDELVASGVEAEKIRIEAFFNNPQRKVPA
jgi:ferredoxin-NADP reductase